MPGVNHGFRGTAFPALTFLVGGITAMFFGWLPLYLPELFPTRVRATGQGVAFNAGRIRAAVGALQMGAMMQTFNGSYAQAGAVIGLLSTPAVSGLVVEHARINADFREARYGQFSLPYTAENPPLRVSDHDPVRLSIGVVRPLSADLALTWATTSMSSRGAFTTLTVHNSGSNYIAGTQVRIDLEIPAQSLAAVGPPSGWTCQRLGDASFLCTATKVLAPGSNNVFTVTVRPRVRFATTDSIRFEAQATVISDPISGDNSAVLVLP